MAEPEHIKDIVPRVITTTQKQFQVAHGFDDEDIERIKDLCLITGGTVKTVI